jgi:c-di-GMP-binding flagellar brake protein YcgR
MGQLPIAIQHERAGKLSRLGDRRIDLRQPCKGSAEIFVLPDGPRVAGTLLDFSPGGCSIKSEAAIHDSKLHAQAELQLEVRGVILRLTGIVCHIRDGRMIGIEFAEANEYKREQVRLLSAEMCSMDGHRTTEVKGE